MEYDRFIKYVESNPFVGNQEACGTGENYWNADYWTLEVAKCLMSGDSYSSEEKYNNNRNYDVNRIRKDAKIKLSVKEKLDKVKDEADHLLICEVGRGLDIIIANSVKKWKKIYCYDHVDYSPYLKIFDNVEFFKMSTSSFNPEVIKEKCIMVINHSICTNMDRFKIDNILYRIVDGEFK